MAIVTTAPTITLPNSTEQCNLHAAHTPIVYTLTRKDYEAISSNNGGMMRIKTCLPNGSTTPVNYDAGVAVGQRFYLNGFGIGTITALFDADEFDTDLPYSALSYNRLVMLDLWPDYYFSVKVYKYVWVTPVELATVRIEHDGTGVARFDLSSIAKAAVSSDDASNYNTSLFNDENQYAFLRVDAAEYTDELGSYNIISLPQVVNAAMQVRSRLYGGTVPIWINTGSNMARYFTEETGQDKALFLSSVRKLRMWRDLPFDIGVINSVEQNPVTGKAFYERILDVNGSDLVAEWNNLLGALVNNRLYRYQPLGNFGGYPAGTRLVMIRFCNEDGTIDYTETMPVRYTDCLPKEPVYLRALDTVGTWRYFCFGTRSEYGLTTRGGEQFRRWVDNISKSRDTGRLLSKSATPTIKVGADLLDEWDRQICEVILASSQVEMLANPLTWNVFVPSTTTYETPDWRVVIVKDGNFQTKTTPTLSTVEMTIELPELAIQTQ